MSRPARILAWALGSLAVVALAGIAAAWLALRASLPQTEGEAVLPGLGAPVAVERDAAGVPVIRGRSRADVARATGYVHAQDRLFQMDLLRRTGAGELAALLGAGLLDADRAIRPHQFRARAREALAAMPAADRAILAAYAQGVNAGASSLGARSFEYALLGQAPAAWRPEDSMLVVYAMWIDLQGLDDADEQQRGRLAAALPDTVYRLLVEPDAESEAPLDGSRLPEIPLPDAGAYDLRKLDRAQFDRLDARDTRHDDAVVAWLAGGGKRGSNNWAVAGRRARDGGALLANDMHLGLRVPNIWYRARLVVADGGIDVSGVSLPGVPAIIAGSNGRVAWGFTNSYGDFQDLVRLEPGPGNDTYLTPTGPREFDVDRESLEVSGGEPVTLEVRRTVWGPVIGVDGDGHELALAWTAHHAEASDLALLGLERARDIDDAAAAIGGAGMPAQNVMMADAGGRIGWVLSGRLPLRQGIDALRPSAWHQSGAGWHGWLPREQSPRFLDPPQGYAWSANARVVGGEDYARIGDGDFAAAARARQIRDRLAALEAATPADLLAIQLDDRADYAARWQPVLLRALESAGEREAARLVAGWSGHAAVDDAGYRLVRDFERKVTARAFRVIAAPAIARWPDYEWRAPERFTEVAWRLVRARPPHLVDPRFADWDDWLADVARSSVADLPERCTGLSECRWGTINTARIRHPVSEAVPALARFLDMPAEPLPGDWSMPRVQSPAFGASERFGVSPGQEASGYFHMPGGQSGHPLSPLYRAGHADWVRGRATPFLPGPAAHVLTLEPRGG
jgi:penicillin amidase